MLYCAGEKTEISWFISGLIASCILLLTLASSPANAADNIHVMVCPAPNQSGFSVLQPQGDSIVNEPKLQVSGTITYISQIDFFIDGTYNNTIAMGYSATDFNADVSFNPGTHTLKFVATDSCSQTTHEQSLVVTYEPKVVPSVGENVDTIVDGQVRPGQDAAVASEQKVGALERFTDRFITPSLTGIKESLDLRGGEPTQPAVVAGNVARTLVFTAGAMLTLAAVHIGALSVEVLPRSLSTIFPFRRRAMTAVAILGLVLMVLVFIV